MRQLKLCISLLLLLSLSGCGFGQGGSTSVNPSVEQSQTKDTTPPALTQTEEIESPAAEITASYYEELQKVKEAGDKVAAYVEQTPIYEYQVAMGLAVSDYTNAQNLQVITDPSERADYMARYHKDYDDMLTYFIEQEIGVLEAKALGITVDEQQLRTATEKEWEQILGTESMQKELEALGITAEEYFETYQYPGRLRNTYFNQLFEQLLPVEDFLDADGMLDKEKRDGAIAEKLQEMKQKYNIRILES